MKRIVWLVMLFALFIPALLAAEEGPTPALGKTLFESTGLGTNGKSCSVCHPKGKGLEEIGSYPDGQLEELINFCIRDALKGKMLAPDSQELKAMAVYLRTLPRK